MLSIKLFFIVLCFQVSWTNEDLSKDIRLLLGDQYIIRPMELRASHQGHKDTVCQKEFCCEFLVRTDSVSKSTSHSLVAFSGVGLGDGNAVQSCGIVSCDVTTQGCGHREHDKETIFNEIVITGNFTAEKLFPTAVSAAILPISSRHFAFDSSSVKNGKMATIRLVEPSEVAVFGIFEKDLFENVAMHSSFYDYIFNDSAIEFIDYFWIRVKIVLFIVSVYFLEMM